MADSALDRPAAVYSALVGLAVLSVCGFVTGLRLYLPHHHAAPATMAAIGPLTPAPQPGTLTAVAFAQDTPPAEAAKPHHARTKTNATDAAAPAAIGDQADAAAITPADRPVAQDAPVYDADGPVADEPISPSDRPDPQQGQDVPRPDAAPDDGR
jgi:hypothetical protein